MSFASSSTSSMLASSSKRVLGTSRASSSKSHKVQVRRYAATATASLDSETDDHHHHHNHNHIQSNTATSSQTSSAPQRRHAPSYPRSSITSTQAQTFLSDLLHLPPSKSFSESLSLQILTHKSYRYVHAHRRPFSPSTFQSNDLSNSSSSSSSSSTADSIHHHQSQSIASEIDPSCAPHNARLSFIGRRAIASYLSMFVHSNVRSTKDLQVMDFLRGRSLEEKLEAMRHVANIGREVGSRWGIAEVVRWDHNEVTRAGGHHKITGMATEAILGALFLQHGSPASHRAFHLLLLPHLARQFRDPELIHQVERMRSGVEGDGIVVVP